MLPICFNPGDAFILDDLKFVRNNGGWRYVLELSRKTLYENAREQASIDVARYAILLERYREMHGTYPETLDALAPDFNDQLPRNPFTSEPYIYERSNETYHLGYWFWWEPLAATPGEQELPDYRFWNDPDGELVDTYRDRKP